MRRWARAFRRRGCARRVCSARLPWLRRSLRSAGLGLSRWDCCGDARRRVGRDFGCRWSDGAECDHHGRRAVPRLSSGSLMASERRWPRRARWCQNFSTTVAWSRSGGPVVCTVRISPMPRAKYLFSPGALGSSRSESFVTSRFLTGPVSGVVSLPVRSRTSPVSSATLAVLIADMWMPWHDDAG